MSLLNNPYALIATASLSIQIVVLFLLLYGYLLKRQLRFRQHGIAMFAAVVLHLAMVFAIMIPSFVLSIFPDFIVWLVASWRFHDVKGCFKKKRIMLTTMALWLVSLSFGIALYTILYWAVLVS